MPEKYDPPVNGHYVPFQNFDTVDWPKPPAPMDRLNQGPFAVEQDASWHTLMVTTPSRGRVRNFGMGLMGYALEEGGIPPTGERFDVSIPKLARLPFCDKLYLRCDWRDVQTRKGRLKLHPAFPLAFSLARELGLGIGIRIQMSTTNIFPKLSIPEAIAEKIPFVKIGRHPYDKRKRPFMEPAYHHPSFQKAFRELNELLAAEFDGNPLIEWVDLMQYGYWGEGHTGASERNPFPDFATALETFISMTKLQLGTWKHTPLAVNTQPDISRVGNNAVIDLAIRQGAWLRTDSILSIEESQQIEMFVNRPPYLAGIIEDGGQRRYIMEDAINSVDCGVPNREYAALHALDAGASYWSLWQMADNLAAFHARFPRCFDTMEEKIGYRVRPSWVFRRKRYNRIELIGAFKNDGVAGVPGTLRVYVESPKGKIRVGGALDPGHPLPGKVRQASFLLPEGVDYEGLVLRAEIECKGLTRPVNWACEQPLNKDGTLAIQPMKCTRLVWRKDQ